MNFAQLQIELERLITLEGWTEVKPSLQPDYASLINEALELWSMEAEYITDFATFPSVGGQAEYDLELLSLAPPNWKIIKDCWWGTGSGSPALCRESEDSTRVRDDQWANATATIPETFFMIRPNVIRLYPPPNTVETIKIFGIRAEPDLVNATDVPRMPRRYHRNLPRLAAWAYGEGFAQGEAAQRLDGYYQKAIAAANDYKLWIASQNQYGLQRTVKLRGVPRVFLTGEDSTVKSV